MKYLLLIYADPVAEAPPVTPAGVHDDWLVATREMREAGAFRAYGVLNSVDGATTVRRRGGERLVSDGPFAETKEHLLGFYSIEVPDLDAALRYAAGLPAVTRGSVEVRPVLETPAAA